MKAYFYKLFYFEQYRFTDKEIEYYCDKSQLDIASVKGSTGDLILTDTKGIHRGKPLVEGERYVLFCYFWDKEIPKHFAQYMQRIDKKS